MKKLGCIVTMFVLILSSIATTAIAEGISIENFPQNSRKDKNYLFSASTWFCEKFDDSIVVVFPQSDLELYFEAENGEIYGVNDAKNAYWSIYFHQNTFKPLHRVATLFWRAFGRVGEPFAEVTWRQTGEVILTVQAGERQLQKVLGSKDFQITDGVILISGQIIEDLMDDEWRETK